MTAPSASLLLAGLTVLLFGRTVSADHSVFLEFPNPVTAGSDVTLRCKTRDSSTFVSYFFRNESFLGYTHTGEFTINNVQHSDEGLYRCSAGLFSQSSKTWLSVKDPDAPSPLLVGLLRHLVVVSPYFISTILMVSIYCSKRKGNNTAITMETDSRVEGGRGWAVDHDYVTTVHNF